MADRSYARYLGCPRVDKADACARLVYGLLRDSCAAECDYPLDSVLSGSDMRIDADQSFDHVNHVDEAIWLDPAVPVRVRVR